MPLSESALVVLVPEVEPLVKPFRDQYDPSAAAGVPAHITLLYPFKAPDEIDETVLRDLRGFFRRFVPFRFSFASIRRYPDAVLYLAPALLKMFRTVSHHHLIKNQLLIGRSYKIKEH